MLYNDNIYYNQPGLSFLGTLLIYIPGVSSPITVNNILIQFGGNVDNSNSTTIGVVTIMSVTTGSISMQVNSDQASAIITASSLSVNEYSEVSIQY